MKRKRLLRHFSCLLGLQSVFYLVFSWWDNTCNIVKTYLLKSSHISLQCNFVVKEVCKVENFIHLIACKLLKHEQDVVFVEIWKSWIKLYLVIRSAQRGHIGAKQWLSECHNFIFFWGGGRLRLINAFHFFIHGQHSSSKQVLGEVSDSWEQLATKYLHYVMNVNLY